MTNDDAFLLSIIQNPDDDAPRLLYADWLDERGRRETADFIRIQCVLAAGRAAGAIREDMERREHTFLLGEEFQEWIAPLRPWAHSIGFRRGFAENVSVGRTQEEIGPCVREVVRRASVRNLDIEGMCDIETDLSLLSPSLERLQGFMLSNLFNLDRVGLERLLTSPRLARLQTLVLDSNHNGIGFRTETLTALFAAPHWARLSTLVVHEPDDKAVLALARAPSLTGLTRLDIADVNMSVETAAALAESPILPQLAELNLGLCEIGEEGVSAAPHYWRPPIESPNLFRVRWLGLDENITNPAVKAMWRERFPPGVVEFGNPSAVPWRWHRWNSHFPEHNKAEFVVADCASPTPRRFP
jgi:uncharacterized protein (TIGR02996 family)